MKKILKRAFIGSVIATLVAVTGLMGLLVVAALSESDEGVYDYED